MMDGTLTLQRSWRSAPVASSRYYAGGRNTNSARHITLRALANLIGATRRIPALAGATKTFTWELIAERQT